MQVECSGANGIQYTAAAGMIDVTNRWASMHAADRRASGAMHLHLHLHRAAQRRTIRYAYAVDTLPAAG